MAKEVATTKPASPVQQFKQELTLRADMFRDMLPQHIQTEKFTANLVAAVTMTPKLLDCNRASLFRAAMTAANLGLMVDPVLGHAYLVPYGETVQCIPGYKGLIHLARQSGEIATLYSHEVYKNDDFSLELGTSKAIHHKPLLSGERGELIGVYAAWSYAKAVDQDGKLATDFEYMSIADIEDIRKRSKQATSGPWKTDYTQMARKTVIRRASKYLPLSVQRAAILDQAYDTGARVELEGGEIIVHDVEVQQDEQPAARKQLESLAEKVRQDDKSFDQPHHGHVDEEPPPYEDTTVDYDAMAADIRKALVKATDMAAFKTKYISALKELSEHHLTLYNNLSEEITAKERALKGK